MQFIILHCNRFSKANLVFYLNAGGALSNIARSEKFMIKTKSQRLVRMKDNSTYDNEKPSIVCHRSYMVVLLLKIRSMTYVLSY